MCPVERTPENAKSTKMDTAFSSYMRIECHEIKRDDTRTSSRGAANCGACLGYKRRNAIDPRYVILSCSILREEAREIAHFIARNDICRRVNQGCIKVGRAGVHYHLSSDCW